MSILKPFNILIRSTTEAKLNNFLRLEPTFGLLNIRFDTNMVGTYVCINVRILQIELRTYICTYVHNTMEHVLKTTCPK